MAAFHELQEELKIKRVNDELLEHLLSSVPSACQLCKEKTILPYLRKTKLQKY